MKQGEIFQCFDRVKCRMGLPDTCINGRFSKSYPLHRTVTCPETEGAGLILKPSLAGMVIPMNGRDCALNQSPDPRGNH
ncbi:MAG: hypothetical protein LBB80_04585 [Treponema sp.]|nr:hypothetical protein [Treponema sp.]